MSKRDNQESEINYRLLAIEDITAVSNLVTNVFISEEPLASHLRLSAEEFRPFAIDLVSHVLAQGLSWGAINVRENRIVGARLSADLEKDFAPQKSYGPKMDILSAFLETVSERTKSKLDSILAPTIHAHVVAVDPGFRGRRIGAALLKHASRFAFKQGYVYSHGEVTHAANHKILSRIQSFEPLCSVTYKDFHFRGQRPFENLAGQEECVAFRFRLNEFDRGDGN